MNNVQRKSRVEQNQSKNNTKKLANEKIKKMVTALKKYLMIEERNKGVYEAITKFIEELYDSDESEILEEAHAANQKMFVGEQKDANQENEALRNRRENEKASGKKKSTAQSKIDGK